MTNRNRATEVPLKEQCNHCPAKSRAMCSHMDSCELDVFKKHLTRVTVPHGEYLFHEDTPATHIYNVVTGCIKLFKSLPDGRRQIVGFAMQGDVIGQCPSGTYTYTAQVLDGVSLCKVPSKDLPKLKEDIPSLTQRMVFMTEEKLADAEELMLLLGRKTAKEKVVSFLLHLSKRNVELNKPADVIYLPMTRSDIADYLGLTTESVSRTITRLRNDKCIETEGQNCIYLTNPEILKHTGGER